MDGARLLCKVIHLHNVWDLAVLVWHYCGDQPPWQTEWEMLFEGKYRNGISPTLYDPLDVAWLGATGLRDAYPLEDV